MATEREAITRGHELYIKHVSLFGRAVPLTIKAAIRKLVQNKGHTLAKLLTDKKEDIRIFYNDLFKVVFEDDDGESIDERLESLGITTLCDIVLLLIEQPNVDYIKCILDQRRDLEKYAKDNFLEYKTFRIKHNALQKSLLKLFEDTDIKFEVTRLIHSFDESKDIQISNEAFNSLELTDDVARHIEIVKECVSSSYAKEAIEEKRQTFIEVTKDKGEGVQTVLFVQQLSDTILRAGESSVLVCELNKEDCPVVWSKNGETIIETRTVHILADKGRHYLVFSKAVPEDSGTYKCTYKHLSTSASLIIAKKPDISIETPLHNEQDGDISEYMRVVLSCTINLTGKTPRWFHSNKEIEASNAKLNIVSTDCEHKLVIEYVTSDDCGEYMVVFDGVTSKMTITTRGNKNLRIKHQMEQKHYKNWIKGVLGLKYVKLGLQTSAKKAIESHHTQILSDLPKSLSDETCSLCTTENLLPSHLKNQCPRTQSIHKCICSKFSRRKSSRRQCPSNGLCGEIYDMIVRDHRFEDPAMRNARMDLWKTDELSVAACYMSNTQFIHTSAYQYKRSVEELDCAEILSLFYNNKTYLQNTNCGVFDTARRHRNELLHNPNYEISDDKLLEYLKDFQDVLEVKNDSNQKVFGNYQEIKESSKALKELKDYDIDIHTNADLEKMKKEIKDAAMNEAAVKLGDAMKQKKEEIQRLEKKLECVPQEMCQKHDGTRNSWYCIDHGRLICKSCMDKEHKMCPELTKLRARYIGDKQITISHMESHLLRENVISLCSLPRGEFLAIVCMKKGNDKTCNYEMCKFNSDFSPKPDRKGIQYHLYEICYIANNKVIGTTASNFVFIDAVALDILQVENCTNNGVREYGLACHGDIIYACNSKDVYSFTTNGANLSAFCSFLPSGENLMKRQIGKIDVSDDGESIYCLHGDHYMSKINSRNGDVLFTYDLSLFHITQRDSKRKDNLSTSSFMSYVKNKLKSTSTGEKSLGEILCIRYIGGGQVIICDDKGNVVKLDDRCEYGDDKGNVVKLDDRCEYGDDKGNVRYDYVVTKIPAFKAKSSLSTLFMYYDTTTSNLLVEHEGTIDVYNVL